MIYQHADAQRDRELAQTMSQLAAGLAVRGRCPATPGVIRLTRPMPDYDADDREST
jgi:hypothetical protein